MKKVKKKRTLQISIFICKYFVPIKTVLVNQKNRKKPLWERPRQSWLNSIKKKIKYLTKLKPDWNRNFDLANAIEEWLNIGFRTKKS